MDLVGLGHHRQLGADRRGRDARGGKVDVRMCTVGSNAFINGRAKGTPLAITQTRYQPTGATNTSVT